MAQTQMVEFAGAQERSHPHWMHWRFTETGDIIAEFQRKWF